LDEGNPAIREWLNNIELVGYTEPLHPFLEIDLPQDEPNRSLRFVLPGFRDLAYRPRETLCAIVFQLRFWRSDKRIIHDF
jgi:hypothetical protein